MQMKVQVKGKKLPELWEQKPKMKFKVRLEFLNVVFGVFVG